MKTILASAVFECLLLISSLQQFSLAVPVWQANEDGAVVSADTKRDAEYRNAQFSAYICRVQKAANLVRIKLEVSFKVAMLASTNTVM